MEENIVGSNEKEFDEQITATDPVKVEPVVLKAKFITSFQANEDICKFLKTIKNKSAFIREAINEKIIKDNI